MEEKAKDITKDSPNPHVHDKLQDLSFENTEIAFRSKTPASLKKAYWLFKMVGSPLFVKVGKVLTNFALKLHIPIGWVIKPTIFQQFCGGESISECAETTKVLDKYGIGTILDYSVEGKKTNDALDATAAEVLRTVETADGNDHIPFSVFKITGISRFGLLEKLDAKQSLTDDEQLEFNQVKERLNNICKRAHQANTPVFIDAEESWIQDTIDNLAMEMMAKYNKDRPIVYNTVQLYRHDRLAFLKQSYSDALEAGFHLGVKLVRGAYMEKERDRAEEIGYPSPIQPDKFASDRDYDLALEFCIENLQNLGLCAGTHNEKSSLHLAKVLSKNNISKDDNRIYFAQLFGMSDHISFNLSDSGYNVAKYVPYGPIREVVPYLIRRAEENTSVEGQTSRELGLIMKERKRRRQSK